MTQPHFLHPSWPVIHEDNHLLALYKPAGLLVQGDKTGDISLLELAKQWLKERYSKPGDVYLGMVHRLDRPVAGVVLFCRTSKAAGRISEQFRNGTTRKHYLAVVEGNPKQQSGVLMNYIERRSQESSRIVGHPTRGAQEARLSYEVLEAVGSRALLRVELGTGRKHQIRLQLANAGHPVVGDLRYGAPSPMAMKQIALLAHQLQVSHPVKQEPLMLQAPIPSGWPWPGLREGQGLVPWNWREFQELMALSGDH